MARGKKKKKKEKPKNWLPTFEFGAQLKQKNIYGSCYFWFFLYILEDLIKMDLYMISYGF